MKQALFALMGVCAVAASSVHGQPVAAGVAAGDQWVYRQTVERPGEQPTVSMSRFGAQFLNTAGKLVMAVTPGDPAGRPQVWRSLGTLDPATCFLDVIAQQPLPTETPCVLPAQGTSWKHDTADSFSTVERRFTVHGRERIEVPAGTFDAWKIDSTRIDTEVVYPGVSTPPTGPIHSHTIYWYAPEVKAMVKVVRERKDAAGTMLSRQIEELQHFENKKRS